MKRKLFSRNAIVLLLLGFTTGAIFLTSYFSKTYRLLNRHERYAQYLESLGVHNPEHLALTTEQIKSMPKHDRPDLAWKQNFLETLDPALGHPATERLMKAYRKVKSFSSLKSVGVEQHPWEERGPYNVGGRTRALMFDPNDATLKKVWAGGATGGIWFNDDITNTSSEWTPVNDFLDNIAISCIAYDPNNTQVFYAGTGEGWKTQSSIGGGIWKTTDGGANWNHITGTENYKYINDIAVRNESGNSVLYVAVATQDYQGTVQAGSNNQGLYRSTNGGISFTQVLPSADGEVITPADIEIGADNRLYVGSNESPTGKNGGKILFSDNGTNWTSHTFLPTDAGRVEIAVAPSNANYVYAVAAGQWDVEGIYFSTNKGVSWNIAISMPTDHAMGEDFSRSQAWYDLIMQVDPNDEETLYLGVINMYRTKDATQSWEQLSSYPYPSLHSDQHAIVFRGNSSSEAIFGNDGGVYYSNNLKSGSHSFELMNNRYNVTQYYACAIHPGNGSNYFLAGCQDNGSQQFDGPGIDVTRTVGGGDGCFTFIDKDNPNIQIVSAQTLYYKVSNNGGSSFSVVQNESGGQFINPAAYDHNLNILYTTFSNSELNKISDVGSNNTIGKVPVNLGTHFYYDKSSCLTVSPYTTASTTIFAGTGTGKLFKITNANTSTPSQTEITGSNFPTGTIKCVEIGANENEIVAIFSNYGVESVWYTANGGSTWVSKESDLPDMPVRWALFNPLDRNEMILATDVGVWTSTNFNDTSPNWIPSNSGLANVRVDMLKYRSSDHMVLAATYGRGLFTSDGFKDSGSTGGSCATLPYSEGLESGIGSFVQQTGDDLDWILHTGSTPSQNTGASSAVEGSYYLYVESSSPNNPDKVANLDSECFDLSSINGAKLSFKYHMYGSTMGTLNVQVSTNDGANWNTEWTKSGDQGNNWLSGSVDLSSYLNQSNVKIRFNAITGSGYTSDICIDEIQIVESMLTVPAPVADFTYSSTSVTEGEWVGFTDVSTNNPTSWTWTFEEGDPATSTLQNPLVTYNTAGTYTVTLTATNDGGSDTETKTALITVNPAASNGYATLPYSTGFESGSFDEYWSTETENSNGRIQVTSANSPSGSYHMTMDVVSSGQFCTNGALLKVNLAGKSGVSLSFDWKEFGDENHNQDGIYISDDDGASYTKIYSLKGGTSTYETINIDLSNEINSNSLSHSSTFVIKFQQRDNYSIDMDGFGIDNVSISDSPGSIPLAPKYIDESDMDMVIYPNPASEFVHVKAGHLINKVCIYDMDGNLVNQYLYTDSSKNEVTISVNSYAKGIYIMKVYTEDKTYSHKLIVKD